MSDSNKIQACKDLVTSGIPSEFSEADSTLVGTTPEKLIEYGDVALWGQHQGSGDKIVHPRNPRLMRWLESFAESGVGPSEDYDDVKYKSPANHPTYGEKNANTHTPTLAKNSGTTTPVTSL
jgi:hypothetical protein